MSKVTIPDVKMFEQSATIAVTLTAILSAQQLSSRFEMMNIEVANTGGTNALDQFVLYAQTHPSGSWHILEATWTTASGWLIKPGRLDTVAKSTAIHARVNVKGLHSVKCEAASAATTTAATIRGSFSG